MASPSPSRSLSLAKGVAAAGGLDAWNASSPELRQLLLTLSKMVTAKNVEEALEQVHSIMSLGHQLWAYAYMRMLYHKSPDLYYTVLLAEPVKLLPVVYTPTVGEACQKFGLMPQYRRGCYVSLSDRGHVREVLEEYARAELPTDAAGRPLCDCIVFSDGGRILGLGDLAAWGMGIPIGKLDLYTVCAGVNPYRTIPLIIDAGCFGTEGNTDHLIVRDHPLYTGMRANRQIHTSAAGTQVNTAYYGKGSIIRELFEAATSLFGRRCLLQFEDFNSNDAFPLLEEYKKDHLTYNDDIQGTAAVAVAAIMGAIKLRDPLCTNYVEALQHEVFLFHGAGSANLGTATLLRDEAGVPASSIYITNSRGVVWYDPSNPKNGNFRNGEQKGLGARGPLNFDGSSLLSTIKAVKPSCLIGAVGRDPNCFNKQVIETMLEVNPGRRPVVFALSNPMTKAEVTAVKAYGWSSGRVIYGSGTAMPQVQVGSVLRSPGQVNNVYIFPGVSFGAICCAASTIPEKFFLAAARGVAKSLDDADVKVDSVVPSRARIREVSLNVATEVVLEAQRLGLAAHRLGEDRAAVMAKLREMMWSPPLRDSRL